MNKMKTKETKRGGQSVYGYFLTQIFVPMAEVLILFEAVRFVIMRLTLAAGNLLLVKGYLDAGVKTAEDLTAAPLFVGVANLLAMGISGLVCLAVFRRDIRLGEKKKEREQLWNLPVFIMGAACLMVGLNLLIYLLQLNLLSETFGQIAGSQASVPVWCGILLYGAAAPLAEEVVFRGVIYERSRRVMPVWAAMLLSGVIFCVYHGNLVQGIYAAALGVILAWLYETNGLHAAVIFHAAGNLAVYFLLDVWNKGEVLVNPLFCIFLLGVGALSLWWLKRGIKKGNTIS